MQMVNSIKHLNNKRGCVTSIFRSRFFHSPLILNGAFNQDRTGDLILTMDALYLLSYKGKCFSKGTTYSMSSTKKKVKIRP